MIDMSGSTRKIYQPGLVMLIAVLLSLCREAASLIFLRCSSRSIENCQSKLTLRLPVKVDYLQLPS
jgi:hypothetical protein